MRSTHPKFVEGKNEGEKNEWGRLRGEHQWFLSRTGEIHRTASKAPVDRALGHTYPSPLLPSVYELRE